MKARYVGEVEGGVTAFGVTFPGDRKAVEVPDDFADKVKGNRFFEVNGVDPAPQASEEADVGSLSIIEPKDELEPLEQPAEGTFVKPTDQVLVAKHRGRGNYSIMRGHEEVREGLSKADADAFNGMTDDDKAAYVASED